MDLEQSLDEQTEEFDQIKENKRSTVLLRTQLSVRVHTCVGKFSQGFERSLKFTAIIKEQE